jgi:hypothetical protein
MNIAELNYLVLSSVRELVIADKTLAASMFSLDPDAIETLRTTPDSDLRRLALSAQTPLIKLDLDKSWFSAFAHKSARTIGWDDLVRCRAALINGKRYDH